ncbi:DUF2695 domain-containing protein [uncultured Jatrophihabitans sp.]|uniref:DUF2695 domain-containing protein n=1 Tax=uncultured Jatrophihabitans sp. TaxID=1610747 RepID=UPI0035CAE37F
MTADPFTDPSIIDQAEALVRQLAAELTAVYEGECLCCYVWRQLDEYPCDGTHRHAIRFRDAAAPRATALRVRLSRVGACCCDCELFMSGYQPQKRFWTPEREVTMNGVARLIEGEPPEVLPSCAGVRRGSVQPCTNWVSARRRWR